LAIATNVVMMLRLVIDSHSLIWRGGVSCWVDAQNLYAIAARKHIEIRWCLSHCGVESNEIADEWAKQAVDEPDARGVEWHRYIGRCGRKSAPACSLAHTKCKCSEAKWTDASKWVKEQLARTSNRKYRPSDKQS